MAPPDDDAERRYPHLFELLTRKTWPDGKQRFTALIQLSMGLGLYELRIQCPDRREAVQKRLPLLRLAEAWKRLEAALVDPSVPWQEYEDRRTRRRKDMLKEPD